MERAAGRQNPQLPQLEGAEEWHRLPDYVPAELVDIEPFDCEAWPELCKAPFHCANWTFPEVTQWLRVGYAFYGEPNLRSWCGTPEYSGFMTKCATGQLNREAALDHKRRSEAGEFGPTTNEQDASYCFIEGMCTNKDVTYNTTIQDATLMCDERLGHEAWTSHGFLATPSEDRLGFLMDLRNETFLRAGYPSADQARPMLIASCAMGNYHCDVLYCRETHCQDPKMIEKYGHFRNFNRRKPPIFPL